MSVIINKHLIICGIGEVVEQKWKDLVDTFRRKEKSGGMTVEKLASWKFYNRMSFMHPYIQSRR